MTARTAGNIKLPPSAPLPPGSRQMVELMARITYRRMKQRQSLPASQQNARVLQ